MYFDYGTEGFITLFVIILLCLLLFLYLRKLYHRRIEKDKDLENRKYGVFLISIGLIVSFISIIAHLFFQIDLSRSSGFFRFLSEITASPMLFSTIVFFIIGVTLLSIGLSATHFRKKTLDKSI